MECATADADTLFHQASDTVYTYLTQAVKFIDLTFGDGYAKKHPELVAGFIQAAASDYGHSLIANAIAGLGDKIDAFQPAGSED